jgi:hypothetical protein
MAIASGREVLYIGYQSQSKGIEDLRRKVCICMMDKMLTYFFFFFFCS